MSPWVVLPGWISPGVVGGDGLCPVAQVQLGQDSCHMGFTVVSATTSASAI
jgi:hypothetical protein